MSAIRFERVVKQFPRAARPSVDGCSFEVEAGEFVVLLGPSGCGKTTLMKMVNRLYEPTAGTIYLDGVDVRQINTTLLRRQIGYVIQQVGLFPHMTVGQNIAVVPELLGWDRARILARVDDLLTLIHLQPDEYRHRYPAQLSGGQQQRVGLARALAGDPHVLLMDEPFGAIDAITRTSLQNEMLRLQRTLKKTILFVTHDVEEALYLADKIVVMQAGKVVQYARPFDLLSCPANAFVQKLIGADDMVRHLSVLRVAAAMAALPTGYRYQGGPMIEQGDDLRRALSMLLQAEDPTLTVFQDTVPVGILSLDHIRRATRARREA